LTNNAESGTLNATNLAKYDVLVQDCLGLGAHCIIDIHKSVPYVLSKPLLTSSSYARFNGAIIGQGGPSNTIFASLWSAIATKYKSNANIIFGVYVAAFLLSCLV
jgi:endoglucanase